MPGSTGENGNTSGACRPGNLKALVRLAALFALFVTLLAAAFADGFEGGPESPDSEEVISRYLAATAAQKQPSDAPIQVDIDASIPNLKKEGKMRVLRKISELGKITYKQLGFQGDETIKTEVIARYLEAEQKGQDNTHKLAITPQNYKFKYKGLHKLQNGEKIHIIFLTPRRKEVGLFKGEMWLDADTYLPIMESGKFVKNPSIFFKKVEFVRDFKIEDKTSVPQHMLSTIDARLIGRVNLSVDYSVSGTGPARQSTSAGDATRPAASPAHEMVK